MSEPEAMQGQAGAGSPPFERNERRPADGELRLIDLPVSGADRVTGMSAALLTFVMAVVAAIAALLVGTFVWGRWETGAVLSIMAVLTSSSVCLFILFFWNEHRWHKRSDAFQNRLRGKGPMPLHQALAADDALREDASRIAFWPAAFLDVLRRCGCYGVAIRLLPRRGIPDPVVPIGVAFEPVVIDESDPALGQIAQSELHRNSRSSPEATAGPVIRDETMSAMGRRLRRVWRLGVFGVLLRIAPEYAAHSGFMPRPLRRYHGLVWILCCLLLFPPLALVLLVIAVIYWAFRDPSPRSQIWAFPGGLLLPRQRMIVRREQTLVVYNVQTMALAVALPDQEPLIFLATPMEAEFALRALLSPVPSPSDEMLRSFMDGR